MTSLTPFGEHAALLDTSAGTPAASARRSVATRRAIARKLPGVDVVAGGDRVLVLASFATVRAAIADLDVVAEEHTPPTTHVVDVVYDGEDLEEVAAHAGLSTARVVEMHAEGEYAAEVIGFLPGFGYLGEVPAAIRMPRRASPRPRVPAGSVAIAGRYTGIYPFASPGGWRLVGRAIDARLFDPTRDPPARFAPGDRVRFRAVVDAPQRGDELAAPPPPSVDGAALSIERITPHATLQDLGRRGLRGVGVPWSGAWDRAAHVLANRAVGNADDRATLELPFGGLVAVAQRALVWSVDGAPPSRARPGDRLVIEPARRAVRYLAVAGGFDVPVVLGSCATLVSAGIGGLAGRRLRKGDALHVANAAPTTVRGSSIDLDDEALLRDEVVVLSARIGPDVDELASAVSSGLVEGVWTLSSRLDRTGARFDGPRVMHTQPGDRAPRPVLPGAVQITPDGTPILLGPDAAVTGGYPVALVLGPEACDMAARLQPGQRVRFGV